MLNSPASKGQRKLSKREVQRQGRGNLLRDDEGFFEWNWALLDALGESGAFDKLHYEVVWADIVERADVGVIQLRDHLRFLFEAFGEFRFGNFEHDVAIEPRIAGFIHLSHAACADQRDDLVGAEFGSGRHFFSSAVQFSTSVSGGEAVRSDSATAKIRCPSSEMS